MARVLVAPGHPARQPSNDVHNDATIAVYPTLAHAVAAMHELPIDQQADALCSGFVREMQARLGGDPWKAAAEMLEGLLSYVTPIAGVPLRPWEMNGQTWRALRAVALAASGHIAGIAAPSSLAERAALMRWVDGEFARLLGYGPSGPCLRSPLAFGPPTHERFVAHALALGLDVPLHVLDESARTMAAAPGLRWGQALVERTFMRGRLPVGQLEIVYELVEDIAGVLIDESMFDDICIALAGLDPEPSTVAVDDALYLAGLLPALAEQVIEEGAEDVMCGSPVAQALAAELEEAARHSRLAALQRDRQLRKISARQFALQSAAPRKPALVHHYELACDVVRAAETRDLSTLTRLLDTPPEVHAAAKAFALRQWGINVIDPDPMARRRAIASFCQLSPISPRSTPESRTPPLSEPHEHTANSPGPHARATRGHLQRPRWHTAIAERVRHFAILSGWGRAV